MNIRLPIRIPNVYPPIAPHTNAVVALHRQTAPNDSRDDSQLTLAYGDANPALVQKYPDFGADYRRLSEERRELMVRGRSGDIVRQVIPLTVLTNSTFTVQASFPIEDAMMLNFPGDAHGFVLHRGPPTTHAD